MQSAPFENQKQSTHLNYWHLNNSKEKFQQMDMCKIINISVSTSCGQLKNV